MGRLGTDRHGNDTEKKAPMATWILVTVAIGLLVMLAIGIAVL